MSKNSCHRAVEYMYQYLDGELSSLRASRIRLHLRRCGGCVDAFKFETKLKELIRQRGRTDPPPELFEQLRALIDRERAASGGGAEGSATES